jgi:hypothetical protein
MTKPAKLPKTKREKWEALQRTLTHTNPNFCPPILPTQDLRERKHATGIFRSK